MKRPILDHLVIVICSESAVDMRLLWQCKVPDG